MPPKSELEITNEEFDKLSEALKNAEFRKILAEYAEEISDPNNRALYEKEIAMLEAERGNDISFLKPEPGHVIKTQIMRPPEPKDIPAEAQKAFINVCTSLEIVAASSTPVKGKKGQQWSLPYSLGRPKVDKDHAGIPAIVIDFAVHPDTYALANQSVPFHNMLIESAIEGIHKQLGILLHKEFKRLKLKCKGTLESTVIRRKNPDFKGNPTETSTEFLEKMVHQPDRVKNNKPLIQEIKKTSQEIETPTYQIIQRGIIDYSKFTNDPKKYGSRPDALVVRIELPKLVDSSLVDLDFENDALILNVPKVYCLKADLPFPVDSENGNAKFDKQKRQLIVTLPVIPEPIPKDEPFKEEEEDSLEEENAVKEDSLEEENVVKEDSLVEENPQENLESNLPEGEKSIDVQQDIILEKKESVSTPMEQPKMPIILNTDYLFSLD